jgi:copper chaperone
MQTVKLAIEGMTCQGCVASLTRALQAAPGVSGVSVSLEQANATVEIDPACTSADKLREVVESAGFAAG